MAKDSYLRKHLARTGEVRSAEKAVSISEEIRNTFEAGKIILIDKPLHWTSFDVVKKIRGVLRIKKVGHAGTLDPLATGLLIICTGKFTKKINELMLMQKKYTGTFTLGAVTPTFDLESTPEDFKEYLHLSLEDMLNAASQLTGHLMQKPPVYSAIKKKGTPLYELARRGEDVELEPRPVVIYAFNITGIKENIVSFEVVCSTGTYIRSLANDFGKLLGCGAYLSALRRTSIGEYAVSGSLTVDQFLYGIKTDS